MTEQEKRELVIEKLLIMSGLSGRIVIFNGKPIEKQIEAVKWGWRCWTSQPDEKRRAETQWN